jgi:hypothetical protein
MKGIPWGVLYNKYKNDNFDSSKLEEHVTRLMADDDVTNKKGIYHYLLTHDERHLNIRIFDKKQKREAYERQRGICTNCKERFNFEDMQADHIKPWSKGGKTDSDNCQLLCADCNRRKSGI